MLKISAAVALMAGSLGLTGAAYAQRHDNGRDNDRVRVVHVEHRYEGNRDGDRYERSHNREGDRYERSHRRDWRNNHRRPRCRTEWRHHHRVRVCR
jgi:hypothetical protein